MTSAARMDSLLVLFALLFIFLVYRIFGKAVADVFLLMGVAVGGSSGRRAIALKSRMHIYVTETTLLDEVTLKEVFGLCRKTMTWDVPRPIEELRHVLSQYKYISLYRDRVDGSLRGMLLVDEIERKHRGIDIVRITMGLSLFKEGYRGGALAYIFYLSRILRQYVVNFGKPVYVLVKVFSYKGYHIGMLNSLDAYPRYDAKTPEFEKSLIDEFGYSMETSTRKYNPDTGVLEQDFVQLEEHQAPITEEELTNPHTAHFVKMNPGWDKGHCLIMIVKMTPKTFLRTLGRVLKRRFFRGERISRRPLKKDLLRKESVSDFVKLDSFDGLDTSSFISALPIDDNSFIGDT